MLPLNYFHYFLIAVIAQGVFLSLLLWTLKKGDPVANKLLGIVVFLMTYYTFVFFINDSGYKMRVGTLFLTGYSLVPLIPMTLYFYLKRMVRNEPLPSLFPHLVPFLVQFIVWLPNNTDGFYYLIHPADYQKYYTLTTVRIGSFVHMCLFVGYIYASFRSIDLVGVSKEKLSWVRRVRWLYLLTGAIFILGTLCLWLFDWNLARYIFFSFLALFIYVIGYSGFAGPGLVFREAADIVKPKYYSSNISSRQSGEIYTQLQQLMLDSKPFLNANLKLTDVAKALETSPHHLSRAVNENFQGSFQDYLNAYRVNEAKIILRSSSPPKMLAVALDSGFGNKVSFYKHFKKVTKLLPSEFVQQQHPR